MTIWSAINAAFNAVFDVWFGLFSGLPDWVQIFITSIPVTIIALLIFRVASNQDGIRTAKDRIKGYMLELWLYKDDLGVMLRAQGNVFICSLRYMGLALVPMAILLIPVGLVIVQLESQFAFRPLLPGETALLTVQVDSPKAVSTIDAGLRLPDGLVAESPALRIDRDGRLMWRLRVNEAGQHDLGIRLDGSDYQRRLLAEPGAGKLWPQAYNAADWRILGSAAEPPLPAGSPIIRTEIDYARARGQFVGLSSASWWLLLFTLILGFALRGLFGVTF